MYTREFIPLILLATSGTRPIIGRSRFHRMVYLSQKVLHAKNLLLKAHYTFDIVRNAPYAEELHQDLEAFIESALMVRDRDRLDGNEDSFYITPEGVEVLDTMLKDDGVNRRCQLTDVIATIDELKREYITRDPDQIPQ